MSAIKMSYKCILDGCNKFTVRQDLRNRRGITNSKFTIVECKNCSLVRLNPIPNDSEIDQIYSNYIKKGNRLQVENSKMIARVHEKSIKKIKKYASSSCKVLDIGSGLGTFAVRAQRAGLTVKCIEPVEKQFRFSRKVHKLDVFHGTLEEAISENFGRFDVIHFHHVLEHVKNPLEFLNLVKDNFMDKNSIMMFEVPNEFGFFLKTLEYKLDGQPFINQDRPLQHFTFFTVNTILKLLKHANLNLISLSQFRPQKYTKITHPLKFFLAHKIANSLGQDIGNIINVIVKKSN